MRDPETARTTRLRRTGAGATAGGPHLRRSRRILDDLFGPPAERGFPVRYWTGHREPRDGDAPFVLELTWPGALRRMLLPPTERSLGEAYVHGHCDVRGDLEAAVGRVRAALRGPRGPGRLLRLARDLWRLPARPDDDGPGPGGATDPRSRLRRRGLRHSRARDRRAVRHHYDLGNDFFRLWLGPWMQYSSGVFPDGGETLRKGQEAKLEQICRRLRLRPGDRLLDVGCGWGGLLHYAAETRGAIGTGVTLSEEQARAARARLEDAGLSDRCEVRVADYRDLPDGLRFDRVVSVGMVEHVGHAKLPAYFRHVARRLEPGGLFLNQGVVTLERTRPRVRRLRERLLRRWRSFVEAHVFPDGELLTPSERIAPARRAGLELRAVDNLREHYATTLRHWVRRLEESREEAVGRVGAPTYRTWRLYMAGSAHAFEAGELAVLQELYRKPGPG